jgi:hypothetical protein
MPFFVLLCLVLAVIVQINSPALEVLVTPYVIYPGVALALFAIVASLFNKIPETLCYDMAASGILMAWFAYWKPLFVRDSPIFFFFPVYFALLIAFITLFFIGQRHKIDRDSLNMMQAIVDSKMVQPWFIMACVLAALYFEDHFLQYPVMMTLLALRYALTGCLKPK